MLDFFTFVQQQGILLLFKGLLLVLIFVYIIFAFIVINRVRALNRTIFLAAGNASVILQALTVISFLVAVSLFIATIVIV